MTKKQKPAPPPHAPPQPVVDPVALFEALQKEIATLSRAREDAEAAMRALQQEQDKYAAEVKIRKTQALTEKQMPLVEALLPFMKHGHACDVPEDSDATWGERDGCQKCVLQSMKDNGYTDKKIELSVVFYDIRLV